MGAITIDKNKAEYCDRHGYRLDVVRSPMKAYQGSIHGHGITWTRLHYLLTLLETNQCDWVWCVGTDTLVTNLTLPLTSLLDDRFHFIISPDWAARVQADSFLTRNSPEGIGYLRLLVNSYPKYMKHPWVENQAMLDTLDANISIIKVLPQRRMNSYIYSHYRKAYPSERNSHLLCGQDWYGNDGEWQLGDFVLHIPSINCDTRIAEFKRVEPLIVR
jgi:hypothetical protein